VAPLKRKKNAILEVKHSSAPWAHRSISFVNTLVNTNPIRLLLSPDGNTRPGCKVLCMFTYKCFTNEHASFKWVNLCNMSLCLKVKVIFNNILYKNVKSMNLCQGCLEKFLKSIFSLEVYHRTLALKWI
jgi:hypothetical protein